MANQEGENLRRLMAKFDLTFDQVCQQTGLDKRTVIAILDGRTKPRSRTIHQLAKGLGVSTDEFFLASAQLLYRNFDRETNPVVAEVVESHPMLFDGWTPEDFDELHSRHATGGPMTTEGALATVEKMNRNRRLHEVLSVLLETSQEQVMVGFLDMLYEITVVQPDPNLRNRRS